MTGRRYFAGIGSRETPSDVLERMIRLGYQLTKVGFTLRSGGASGADTAFATDAISSEIFTKDSDIPQWAFDTVDKYHPAPEKLSYTTRRLHARNAMILLGDDGRTPVEFIVCWTPGGLIKGGTGQALRIAKDLGIKVYNLYNHQDRMDIESILQFELIFLIEQEIEHYDDNR